MAWILPFVLLGSCDKKLVEYEKGSVEIVVERGDAWLHDFPLFLGIKRKNPPQIAVWIEDAQGRYLSTVYASSKIATQSWLAAGGNRRREALPHWCHSRGVQYADGLYLPTKSEPLADGISGATPRGSFDLKLSPEAGLDRFVVKVEVNHSTDFNETYPESAKEGEPGYSGGRHGSGQPAVVYAADVDLSSGSEEFEAVLVGHSSPDGSSGGIDPDISGLTSALRIVDALRSVSDNGAIPSIGRGAVRAAFPCRRGAGAGVAPLFLFGVRRDGLRPDPPVVGARRLARDGSLQCEPPFFGRCRNGGFLL